MHRDIGEVGAPDDLTVGWTMATHLRTELVLDALEMALLRRRPE